MRQPQVLTESVKNAIKEMFVRYNDKKSAVMAALERVQKEKGHLLKEDIQEVSLLLCMNPVEALEVAAFYTMYNVERPVGRHHVQVCRNLPCSLMGAEHIIGRIEKLLNIKAGSTSVDGKFTLTLVECLGSCGTAPVMQINEDYYEGLTEEKAEEILKGLK